MGRLVESTEERRARYLRLAIAAAVTAAKMPIPKARQLYLSLAQSLKSEADELLQHDRIEGSENVLHKPGEGDGINSADKLLDEQNHAGGEETEVKTAK